MKKTGLVVLALVVSLGMQHAYAADILTQFKSLFGGKSVVGNDYDEQRKEVIVAGSADYSATHDGRYLFAGPILDTSKRTNIVASQENQVRQAYLSAVSEDVFVSYPSKNPSKQQIIVFTDIDCPYCRKLHSHMKNFNQLGISVKYVMLPRSGVGTKSHIKTANALCSDNPADVITRAMKNENPPPKSCGSNPIEQHLKIARDLRMNTTPTIVLPNGQIKLGYVNPSQLQALLKATN